MGDSQCARLPFIVSLDFMTGGNFWSDRSLHSGVNKVFYSTNSCCLRVQGTSAQKSAIFLAETLLPPSLAFSSIWDGRAPTLGLSGWVLASSMLERSPSVPLLFSPMLPRVCSWRSSRTWTCSTSPLAAATSRRTERCLTRFQWLLTWARR